jgi:hypothetical protein
MSTYPLNPANDWNVVLKPHTFTSQRFLQPRFRSFFSDQHQQLFYYQIRQRGPPEDLIANTSDIYLDTSTVSVDVYQKTGPNFLD